MVDSPPRCRAHASMISWSWAMVTRANSDPRRRTLAARAVFAEESGTAESGRSVVYLATATPDDDEMRQRIATHRASRPRKRGAHVEEPLDLPSALVLDACPGDLALLECVTLWVSNLLLAGPSDESLGQTRSRQNRCCKQSAYCQLFRDKDIWVIAVSNEVGMGIVPGSEMGQVLPRCTGPGESVTCWSGG